MRRALALHTRKLPFTVCPLGVSSFVRHFDRLQIAPRRYESTLHNANHNDKLGDLFSAVTHGSKTAKSTASQQKPQNIRTTEPSAPVSQKTAPSTHQKQKGSNATQKKKGSAGRKRKAQKPVVPPATKKKSADRNTTDDTHSIQSARRAAENDKDVPRQLLQTPKTSVEFILQDYATLKPSFSKESDSRFKCVLVCSFPGGEQIAKTTGVDRKQGNAETAAYIRLAVECAHNEHLKSRLVWFHMDKLNNNVLSEEKDVKSDIYNYAARFNATPEIIEHSMRFQSKIVYTITVKLLEQNIEVTGIGPSVRTAEVAAALRFKKAAEKYQAEHGDQPLVINDSTALTLENSPKFLDFYKVIYPDVSIEVQHNTPEGATEEEIQILISKGIVMGQVALNGKLIGQAVSMPTKQKAAEAAKLVAAIEICKAEPDLFPEFIRALAVGNGDLLKPLHPVGLIVDEDCQITMQETLLSARKAGSLEQVEEYPSDEQENSRRPEFRHGLSRSHVKRRNRDLLQRLALFALNPRLAELRKKKERLPMNENRAQVLDLVSNSTYSIIIGATGSGKTTQVPQILLEDAIKKGIGSSCNIICTQPRRIAATSVAYRVAKERAEQLQNSVGYHVRFDQKLPSHGGSITYCTTGVLLQQLQHQPDEVLDSISHIVIDEVHERNLITDFLLIVLKRAMSQRAAGQSTPKIVLMSATMNTELFTSYFGTQTEEKGIVGCPSLTVPGRTFPVKEVFLDEIIGEINQSSPEAASLFENDKSTTGEYLKVEREFKNKLIKVSNDGGDDTTTVMDNPIDWKGKVDEDEDSKDSLEAGDHIVPIELIVATIAHISKTTDSGAILVFLPGLDEMIQVERLMFSSRTGPDYQDAEKYRVFLLHSTIPSAQTDVFDEMPAGCRKIILSTNIAETSVTIPEVKYVVDTGKHREKQYDHMRRIDNLKCTWISKSNAKQRAGRAGRVQDGNYYALYSTERYDTFQTAALPEMLGLDLLGICLNIKAHHLDYPIRDFLAEAIEPPPARNVDVAVKELKALEAITADEEITPLGRLLADLPTHPSLSKMIVLGVIFRCLDPMLIIGVAAHERMLFESPITQKQESNRVKKTFTQGTASDHITLLNAFREMRQVRDMEGEFGMRQWAMENFVHVNAFKIIDQIANQVEEVLTDAGLVPPTPIEMRKRSEYGDPSLNENSSKTPLIKALLVAGLHPNLSVATGGKLFRTAGEARTLIHHTSVNYPDKELLRLSTLQTYGSMSRSNDGKTLNLRDTTECTPLQAALFGGPLITSSSSSNKNTLMMDKWLPFSVRSPNAGSNSAARTLIDFRTALDQLLADAFQDLKNMKRKRFPTVSMGGYLADNASRTAFAEGLVRVLDRDEEEKEERRESAFDEVSKLGSAIVDDLGLMANSGGVRGVGGRR